MRSNRRRELQRLVAVAAVRVELAAARLLVRELDLVPEPLEHVHDGLRRLRKERVAEAGDEEADSQELYRGERDAAVDLDDVKTASGDDRGGDAQRRLRDAVRPSLDEREQRMAGVGGRDGVGARPSRLRSGCRGGRSGCTAATRR